MEIKEPAKNFMFICRSKIYSLSLNNQRIEMDLFLASQI